MKLAIDQKPTRVWINPTGIHCNEMEILHQWNWHKNSPWFMGTSPSQKQKWQMLTIKHHQTSKQDAPLASCVFWKISSVMTCSVASVDGLGPQISRGFMRFEENPCPSCRSIVIWKITIFNGKINYKWSCSIAMLNYQRVDHVIRKNCTPDPHNDHWNRRVNCHMLLSAGADRNQPSWEWLQLYLRA